MFKKEVYIKRRNYLKDRLKEGVVLLLGNSEEPINFPANCYRFRQDSTFLYYFGIDVPNIAAVIDIDNDRGIVFGDDLDEDELIWIKRESNLKELTDRSGAELRQSKELKNYFRNRSVRIIPQYRSSNIIKLAEIFDIKCHEVEGLVDIELVRVIANQRLEKEEREIYEIKKAIEISKGMFEIAFEKAKDGTKEREILAEVEGYAIKNGVWLSFPTILTKDGAILHNTTHENTLRKNDMFILDSGVETKEHYASDITRTVPVDGEFTPLQKDIYQIVKKAQQVSFDSIREGEMFINLHLKAARVIAEGLKELGFLKGGIDDIMQNHAYALFFPHGLGHPLGLDVHDLEALGENYVGYDESVKRSNIFGLKSLRFARKLKENYVMTIEPGIYFIPKLIKKWYEEAKFKEFINYDRAFEMLDFGGIRLEDDVLVLKDSCDVLSESIIKT
ncbi:aminopeptidase P family protein [Hippea alviniae]|uniref:aminopeptidase P family protein n=1 Tax=Hippea alviniae TaxID=1279027 RepID=UPI0003B46FD0|nr:aminopeptidase P family protein [Hippea alviniae]